MAGAQQSPQAMNMMARQAILAASVDMTQQIASVTPAYVPGTALQINIPVRNVGLIKRFWIEIIGNISTPALGAIRLTSSSAIQTGLGGPCVLSQVVLTDLSNQVRVNTTGWHLHMLSTVRRQLAFGAAFTNDTFAATGFGANQGVIQWPSAIAASQATNPFYHMVEVPVAYSDTDLRGAIYANVVNATMNLALTINPTFVGPFAGANISNVQVPYAFQTGNSAQPTVTFTINVYQNYLDQLPVSNGQTILPQLDLATVYLLNNTNATGLAAGADQALPYANFRNFLSTIVGFDNAGTLGTFTGTTTGAGGNANDVNYYALQSANFTNVFKYDPGISSLLTRNLINDDFPAGFQYFSHRNKPLSTIQYGNMQLIVNPKTLISNGTAVNQLLVGYESLAMLNMITQAGSLFQS